jgi:hypothetical protein
MQRSITHQNSVEIFFYIIIFVVYSSLATIYSFLPPMFAVLFLLFARALKNKDLPVLLIVSFCLVVFEANNSYSLFSSIIYFYIISKFVLPKIKQNFSCRPCIKSLYVLFAYGGYFLFMSFVSNIFLQTSPELNYYIVYYIVIEFFLVSIL